MITRLKVKGFKNLVDVDVRFGPFTCVAGPNAAGKSNLFNAIRFLSASASKTLIEAAMLVRNETARTWDVRSLFHRAGDQISDQMSFEVEMIVPQSAVDDLGQEAKATANFLRYSLVLRCRDRSPAENGFVGPLEILKEELVHIHLSEARKNIHFDHTFRWRESALRVARRGAAFISTTGEGRSRAINLHQDGGGRGRAVSNPAHQPRTILSVANAAESPTALCARREMESWQLLQLEPSALREPDDINAPHHLDSNGRHLPATLYHLANLSNNGASISPPDPDRLYCQVANRLSELIDDVGAVRVDRDEKREILTLEVEGKDATSYPARSLSDGTLRFLALTVIELDPAARGVICLEEPENGIHPERIPAMLELLQDIAIDPNDPIDESNPLRQVIVNTHSPSVVLEVPDDTLLVAGIREYLHEGRSLRKAVFGFLPDTWRARISDPQQVVSKGRLISYLNPISPRESVLEPFLAKIGEKTLSQKRAKRKRVADREDLQPWLPLSRTSQ
jgi:predicted ATPase